MRRWYRTAAKDGIPLYDFCFARFYGSRVPLDRAVETLRDYPLDMIEWTVDNSTREDVTRDRTPGLDECYLTRILPRSEMGICGWDQEPYRAVIGMGGQREDKPLDWLVAYWMGRRYGLIGAPRTIVKPRLRAVLALPAPEWPETPALLRLQRPVTSAQFLSLKTPGAFRLREDSHHWRVFHARFDGCRGGR